ncbi:MAG TPA: hypothetical protein VLF60_00525 [Candidatus Saccharimonadales bacterium]|nr:hypothetical protein [Candidatus Saccharimonadales bacterium]
MEKSRSFSLEEAEQVPASPHPHEVHQLGFEEKSRKKRFHSRWHFLRTKTFWLVVILLSIAAGAAVWLAHPARFWVLNTAGVHGGIVLSISDAKGGAAVNGADITLGGKHYQSQKTDNGKKAVVVITDARFGSQQLTVHKAGYADLSQQITISALARRTNIQTPPTALRMTPTGLPVSIRTIQWLSQKPLKGVKVEIGDVVAASDDAGTATLNIPPTDTKEVTVQVSADGFITQTRKIALGGGSQDVAMVASPKHYFISKRTGTLGIYSSNLDGSNPQLVVAGTGKEAEDRMAFEVSPDNKTAALVSTRDGVRNAKGSLLEELYIVDLEHGTLTKVDESTYLTIVAWLDGYVTYTRDVVDQDSNQYDHREIMSYGVTLKDKRTLSQAAYFGGIVAGQGKIFFAPGNNDPTKAQGFKNSDQALLSITPDEKQKVTIEPQLTWQLVRTDFSTLTFETQDQKWHEFNLEASTKKDLAGAPANVRVMIFAQSTNGQRVAWVDKRDGKDVLLVRATNGDTADKVLFQANGIGLPIRWIGDDLIIFRVKNDTETADYIVSLDGGQPHKISDVFASGGVNQGAYN